MTDSDSAKEAVESDGGEKEKRAKVSEAELRNAFSGHAVYVNKIYATGIGQNVRLAFMEQLGDAVSPQFRVAVLMSGNDAVALRDLLSRQISEAIAVHDRQMAFA